MVLTFLWDKFALQTLDLSPGETRTLPGHTCLSFPPDSSGECVGKGREEKGPEHHSVQNFLAGVMGSGKHEEGVSVQSLQYWTLS